MLLGTIVRQSDSKAREQLLYTIFNLIRKPDRAQRFVASLSLSPLNSLIFHLFLFVHVCVSLSALFVRALAHGKKNPALNYLIRFLKIPYNPLFPSFRTCSPRVSSD